MQFISKAVCTLLVGSVLSLVNLGSTGNVFAGFDLKGTVTDSDGAPLADVVVAMYTARPKVGVGIL